MCCLRAPSAPAAAGLSCGGTQDVVRSVVPPGGAEEFAVVLQVADDEGGCAGVLVARRGVGEQLIRRPVIAALRREPGQQVGQAARASR